MRLWEARPRGEKYFKGTGPLSTTCKIKSLRPLLFYCFAICEIIIIINYIFETD